MKKKHPSEVTDKDLKEIELPSKVKDATVRLYIEKVSPFNNSLYSKNVYLDQCIEDLYLAIEGKKIKKRGEIENMKKNIDKLTEIAEQIEDGGEENVELNQDDEEGQGIRFRKRKTKMCKATLEFTQNNAKRALSNSVLSEAEVRCKKDLAKKWEFKLV